jgi:hypothetical protein
MSETVDKVTQAKLFAIVLQQVQYYDPRASFVADQLLALSIVNALVPHVDAIAKLSTLKASHKLQLDSLATAREYNEALIAANEKLIEALRELANERIKSAALELKISTMQNNGDADQNGSS